MKSILEMIHEDQKANIGKRIELEYMEDIDPLPCGSTGVIVNVNPFGDYEVQWDCGRSLSVIPSEDKFRILD
jgi:hypothetical protein